MKTLLKKAFDEAGYRPEPGLPEKIYRVIIARRDKKAQITFWSYSIASILAFAGLIPAVITLAREFALSGFGKYLSLAFSGGGKALLLSIIDSLPTASIILCLALIFALLWSLRVAVQTTRHTFIRTA